LARLPGERILAIVKKALLLIARRVCLLVVAFSAAFLMMHFGRRTGWYKGRLYHQLLTGDADQRLHAASVLAQVQGEEQLLEALKSDEPEIHRVARLALEHLWLYSAGQEAYDLMQAACQAADKAEFKEAAGILDRLIAKYPKYAEGWNRRAAVLWQLGQYQKSMRDCERALALNPNHYGAWQGLGICHLQLGDLAEACHSLRAALRIAPHDDATRRSLQKCEELLRIYPSVNQTGKAKDLL